jgi:hypothetical protein
MVTREAIYHDALQRVASPELWADDAGECRWCGCVNEHDGACPVTVVQEALAWAPCVGARGPADAS